MRILEDECAGKVTVAMLGARRHYAVPRILQEAGLLRHFFTDSYVGNKPVVRAILRALPDRLKHREIKRWLGREDKGLPAEKVTGFELLGLRYALERRGAKTIAGQQAVFKNVADRFSRAVMRRIGPNPGIVWGFNTAALEIFRYVKSHGGTCILEQTILPLRLEMELLSQEATALPGWQSDVAVSDYGSDLASREAQEWQLADQIVVGSSFVREGLLRCGVPSEKIKVIPYGIDLERFTSPPMQKPRAGRLRVLFVGEVGIRKGAPRLLQALRLLGPERVEARFAGTVALCRSALEPFSDVANFLGPVPRGDMAKLFQWADVFALPSIVEGSALSSYEALLNGLPLVVTLNAGTIIQGGEAGQIVPTSDPEAIAAALRAYCDDPVLLARHRQGAISLRDMASSKRYGEELIEFVQDIWSRH